jgi:hypothetical protein
MSRPIRFIPHPQTLVEVTTRTIQGRLLLRPSPALNEIILGILGRAQQLYGVGVCACVFLAGHYHLLLIVDTAEQLADFVGYVNGNLAREAGRLADWREKFWARRYRPIVISDEEAAQRERLKYVLSHGAKEGLVARAGQWPGVHVHRALLEDAPLTGLWFDRTQECAARRRGQEYDRFKYATPYTVELSPLPCWKDLAPETRKKRIAEVIAEIDAEAAQWQEQTGKEPLGADTIRRQNPHQRPLRSKKSPAPLFHAATKQVRDDLVAAYGAFLGAFRAASAALRSGDRTAAFPAGCFPPALPFVSG